MLLLRQQQQYSRRQMPSKRQRRLVPSKRQRRLVPSKQQRLQCRTHWQQRARSRLLQALLQLLRSWRPSRLLPLHS